MSLHSPYPARLIELEHELGTGAITGYVPSPAYLPPTCNAASPLRYAGRGAGDRGGAGVSFTVDQATQLATRKLRYVRRATPTS